MTAPVHQRYADLPDIAIFGVHIRPILPHGSAPGLGFSMFEDASDPGAGPPLHVHHDAQEVFYVAEGAFRFWCEGAALDAAPGDTLVVPKGARHTYLNVGPGHGRLIVTMTPGGFERFFVEAFEAGLSVPDDMARIVELGQRHHIEFVGPNPLAG